MKMMRLLLLHVKKLLYLDFHLYNLITHFQIYWQVYIVQITILISLGFTAICT